MMPAELYELSAIFAKQMFWGRDFGINLTKNSIRIENFCYFCFYKDDIRLKNELNQRVDAPFFV